MCYDNDMSRKSSENNPTCIDPNCGGLTVKHDTRNGVKRYRCKKCGKVFKNPAEETYKYNRREKQIISVLLNMLEHDFWKETDLNKAFAHAIKNTDRYYKYAKNIRFDTRNVKKIESKININCFQPKLIICQDEQNITFIQIPSFKYENEDYIPFTYNNYDYYDTNTNENKKNKKDQSAEEKYKRRTITISDDKNNENIKILYNRNVCDYIDEDSRL